MTQSVLLDSMYFYKRSSVNILLAIFLFFGVFISMIDIKTYKKSKINNALNTFPDATLHTNVHETPTSTDLNLNGNANTTFHVVYIHFLADNDNVLPEYFQHALYVTTYYNNKVNLITKQSVNYASDNVILHPIEEFYQNDELNFFRQIYLPWGSQEPWERQNFERYFILKYFMLKTKLLWVMYIDSDVVLKTQITYNMFFNSVNNQSQKHCSSFLSLQDNSHNINNWETNDWVSWAGTSFLHINVLTDFTLFVLEMYNNQTFYPILKYKKDNAPYVCDMTLWYLYVGSSDLSLSTLWQWKPDNILTNSFKNTFQYTFCNILDLGFDHKHAHLDLSKTTKSIHFQGHTKSDIIDLFNKLKYPNL